MQVRHITSINSIDQLSESERHELSTVSTHYPFRSNDYYNKLINWSDPNDPIRRIIIPNLSELNIWGSLDASNEASVAILPGVQHKYEETVLLLVNDVCAGYCRFCFRKRLFLNGKEAGEINMNIKPAIEYIFRHPEVTNVLLTGGDPLILSTKRLQEILDLLCEIPHVRIIRLGSKMPAFNPFRITQDIQLLHLLNRCRSPQRQIYVMAHFDHPRELTMEAMESIAALRNAGVLCLNQCPVMRGINDNAAVMRELFERLSWLGCPQYYVFQGRPTAGNAAFSLPIVESWTIFQNAVRYGSGLENRAKFVMSHETGKVEVIEIDRDIIYLRYHRAKDPEMRGVSFRRKRRDDAYWLDQLEQVT